MKENQIRNTSVIAYGFNCEIQKNLILQSENRLPKIFITLITSIYIVTVLLNKYKLKSLHIASVICCFQIQ